MLHPATTIAAGVRRALTMATTRRTTMPYVHRTAPIRNSTAAIVGARSFHQSRPVLGNTKEDHLDREKLNPSSTEYSQSGGDNAAAHMDDAAFNPDKTSPEEAVDSAEGASGEVRQQHQQQQPQQQSSQGSSPLNVSPGNHEVSATKDPQGGGPVRSPSESDDSSSSRARTSGRGSPPKHGDGKSGGGPAPGTS